MKTEFCPKCLKPKNYTGRDKHLVSCCKCEEKMVSKNTNNSNINFKWTMTKEDLK